jgi:hypothetical protein
MVGFLIPLVHNIFQNSYIKLLGTPDSAQSPKEEEQQKHWVEVIRD